MNTLSPELDAAAAPRSPRQQALRHAARESARLAGLALLLSALPGCQNITAGMPASQVRIIDATPDAPAIDVYQGGSALAYNLGFGTVTSYVSIVPGAGTISAHISGSKQQLSTAHGTFAASSQYTVLISNVSANLTETVLSDQSTPAPPGQIAVRFLDQTTRLGTAIDLYFVPAGSTLASASPVMTNVALGANSGYLNLPAGTYSVIIVPAGTVPAAATIPLYTGAQVTYSSGSARTLILLDQPGAPGAEFQVITADDFDAPASAN